MRQRLFSTSGMAAVLWAVAVGGAPAQEADPQVIANLEACIADSAECRLRPPQREELAAMEAALDEAVKAERRELRAALKPKLDAGEISEEEMTAEIRRGLRPLRQERRAEIDAKTAAFQAENQQRAQSRLARLEAEQAAASAAALIGDGEAAKVETEAITEANSRSSDEDDDGVSDLVKILGAAAAGFAAGQLLDNGDRVVESTQGRAIVERDGQFVVLKDENALLQRPGSNVETQTFADGSTRTVVTRENGRKIVTVRASDGRVMYRSRINPNGSEVVLIDETKSDARPVEEAELRRARRAERVEYAKGDEAALRRALRRANANLDRTFSLRQVRQNKAVRELMPPIDLDTITFQTGSAAIRRNQAENLAALGREIADLIDENPDEVFLIEGHTDTVGSRTYNLALSDRRAESVALALTEYFDVPPENMIVQGYGEEDLKVNREGDVRANRRATVRRITPLLRTAAR